MNEIEIRMKVLLEAQRRLREMILYFSQESINKTKLNKLLFLSDFSYACRTLNQPEPKLISGDRYLALDHGPVPYSVDSCLTDLKESGDIIITLTDYGSYTEYSILAQREADLSGFPAGSTEIIEKVNETFRQYTAVRLSNFTHLIEPWVSAESYEVLEPKKLDQDKVLKEKGYDHLLAFLEAMSAPPEENGGNK